MRRYQAYYHAWGSSRAAITVDVDTDGDMSSAMALALPLLDKLNRRPVKRCDVRIGLVAIDGIPVVHVADF